LRVLLAFPNVLPHQAGAFDDNFVFLAIDDQHLPAVTLVTAGDH
jgi:hypothetical protein